MGPVIGIDLGTTNTVVAAVRGGRAEALSSEPGSQLIPSVVSFHPNGQVLVGEPAKQRRLIDPSNTIYSIKRLIGRSWGSEEVRRARERFAFQMREGNAQAPLVVARGETYTLPEISAFVLAKAKSVAEAALGGRVERAVITVPANFNDLQRAATKIAGRVAGLEVLRILNEPTAAALAYGLGRGGRERVAVYDFGGGTFDVTLLDLSDNVFEVLATAGDSFLGGDDLDLVIAEKMADELLAQYNVDARGELTAFERLRHGAEILKQKLSVEQRSSITLREIGHGARGRALDFTFEMSRAELEHLARPIIDRTLDVCRQALGIARLSVGDFDQVIGVGGSTRIPLVRRYVEEFFKRSLQGNISPDEVVAVGAAIQAHALVRSEERRGVPVPPPPAPRPGSQSPARPVVVPPPGAARLDPAPVTQVVAHARRAPPAGRAATSLGFAPPDTVSGLGPHGMAKTGMGLGPAAAGAVEQAEATDELDLSDFEPTQVTRPPLASEPGPGRAPPLPERRAGGASPADGFRPLSAPPPPPPSAPPPPAPPSQRPELSLRPDSPPPQVRTWSERTLATPAAPLPTTTLPSAAAAPAAAFAQHLTLPLSADAAPPLLIDVTPLTLSVETVSGYCDTIIERNTPVPCEKTRRFVTASDNQQIVRVRVSQGESRRFVENTLLGQLELTGLRAAPRGGVQIEVAFALDGDGILNVRATDLHTGQATSARVRLLGLPDPAEVAELSRRHAAQAVR